MVCELPYGARFVTTATGRTGRVTWTLGGRAADVEVRFDGAAQSSMVRGELTVFTEVQAPTAPS
jgi:hypothetical protein